MTNFDGRCPQCRTYTARVTLGGFLTIERCDSCRLWRLEGWNQWQRIPSAAVPESSEQA